MVELTGASSDHRRNPRNPETSNATAAHLRTALDAADAAIRTGDEAVRRLEAKRQELLLQDGADDAIEGLDREISTLDRDGERCVAAKAKLQQLIADAEAREWEEDLKEKGRQSVKLAKALTAEMLRWDAALATVGEAQARIHELNAEFAALRKHLAEAGRRDLLALSPLAKLHDAGVEMTRMPAFDVRVPDGYKPPADSIISRPLLRLMAGHK